MYLLGWGAVFRSLARSLRPFPGDDAAVDAGRVLADDATVGPPPDRRADADDAAHGFDRRHEARGAQFDARRVVADEGEERLLVPERPVAVARTVAVRDLPAARRLLRLQLPLDAVHGPFDRQRSDRVDHVGLQNVARRIQRVRLIREERPGRAKEERRLVGSLQVAAHLHARLQRHPLDLDASGGQVEPVDAGRHVATRRLACARPELLQPLLHVEVGGVLRVGGVQVAGQLVERRQNLAQRIAERSEASHPIDAR